MMCTANSRWNITVAAAVTCLITLSARHALAVELSSNGAGAKQAQSVTRPIPITQGGEAKLPSPFYITLRETRYNQPVLRALDGAGKDNPDFVARELISAMAENDAARFAELTVAAEQDQAADTLSYLRGFGSATATLVSRVDLGDVSMYLLKTKNDRAPLASLIVTKTADGYRQSFQMSQQPLCSTVIVLWNAVAGHPDTFASVEDKNFQHQLALPAFAGDTRETAARISFDRGCGTQFIAMDEELGDDLPAPNAACGDDVQSVLQFDRDFWTVVADKDYDKLLAMIDPARAERLKRLRKLRGDNAIRPQLVFTRREVRYVVASPDATVLFSELELTAPGVQSTALKTVPEVVVPTPEGGWRMVTYNVSTPFTRLMEYPPFLSQIVQLADEAE